MSPLVWLIPLFPLLGAIINALGGNAIGHKAHWIANTALALSFLVSCMVFWRVWHGETWSGDLFSWIEAGQFNVAVGAQVDPLTAVMLLVVTGVGFLIHVYSIGYMHDDPGYPRFFAYLNLFVFSMMMLVLAGNFLLLYVFWEAVGLCSYLLIGFWYTRKSAADAGKKAFIVNRVGDFGFGLGVMWLWTALGTLDYAEVFKRRRTLPVGDGATGIALLLFMGACGKSAQLPLHTWLPGRDGRPDAGLRADPRGDDGDRRRLHGRAQPRRSSSGRGVALDVVAWVGVAHRALRGHASALVQTDIKRVLAYSTVSQLGYMFAAVGVGAYAAGIFHLVTHAFFKALLFLGAGQRHPRPVAASRTCGKMGGLAPRMVIDDHHDDHRRRRARRRARRSPASSRRTRSSQRAFAGKHTVIWALLLVGAFMTAFYMFRLIFLTFFGGPRMSNDVAHHVHESPPSMTVPLVVLAVLTVVGGLGASASRRTHGTRFARFLAPVLPAGTRASTAAPARTCCCSCCPSWSCSAGVVLAWYMYLSTAGAASRRSASPRTPVHAFLLNACYVDWLYDRVLVRPSFALSRAAARRFDLGVIDGLVNGSGAVRRAGRSGAARRADRLRRELRARRCWPAPSRSSASC